MYEKAFERCPLFRGLDKQSLDSALDFFESEQKSYPKGSFLNRISTPLTHFGLVLSGTVRVHRDDLSGHHMILANVGAGETFGESLCWLGWETDVYITSVVDVELLWLKTRTLSDPRQISSSLGVLLARRFVSMLAERTLEMNDRIQMLSQVTIRTKLLAYFSQCVRHGGSASFEVPFDRASMAHYLGTDRSALSRELSCMRKAGLIEFSGNRFVLKDTGEWHNL